MLTNLFMHGMFMDGLIYSGISRNMAHGLGTFWNPSWTATVLSSFHEHPPLTLGLQAVFFMILGDSLLVERVYGLAVAVLSLGFLVLIWRQLFKGQPEYLSLGWLPCLSWCLFPLNIWSYSNNLLDNTMVVFNLLAVYLLLKHLEQNNFIYLGGAAVATFLGFLSNGPVALFSLSFFVIAWIAFDKPLSTMLLNTAVYSGLFLFQFLVLISFPMAREDIFAYFSTHFIPSFEGQRYLVHPRRLYILRKLILCLLPQTIIVSSVLLVTRLKKIDLRADLSLLRWALFFLLLGFAASLPIVLSQKQTYRYLLPSLPYFTLTFALILAPVARHLSQVLASEHVKWKILTGLTLSILLLTCVYSALQWHRTKNPYWGARNVVVNILPPPIQKRFFPSRYRRMRAEQIKIHDVRAAGKVVPAFTVIGIDKSLRTDWSVEGYFERFFNISLSMSKGNEFMFVKDNPKGRMLPADYREVSIPTISYRLFKIVSNDGHGQERSAISVINQK